MREVDTDQILAHPESKPWGSTVRPKAAMLTQQQQVAFDSLGHWMSIRASWTSSIEGTRTACLVAALQKEEK